MAKLTKILKHLYKNCTVKLLYQNYLRYIFGKHTADTIILGTYSRDYCNLDCFWAMVNQTCNCVPLITDRKELSYCDAWEMTFCFDPAAEKVHLDSEENKYVHVHIQQK